MSTDDLGGGLSKDDLAVRVKRFQQQNTADTKKARLEEKYSRKARVQSDIQVAGRFSFQFVQGLLWCRKWVIKPIAHWVVWLWLRIIHGYAKLWAYAVYRRTEDDVLIFSKTRAGAMILATGIFCWYLLLPVTDAVFNAGLYAFTAHSDEKIYLFGSQEIDPVTAVHNIEGADKIPWTPEDSMYFRAEGGLFPDLWMIVHGKGFLYWPENVGAAVPYGYSDCHITYYGLRLRMWGVRNSFMRVLDVSCMPLLDKNVPPPPGTENH